MERLPSALAMTDGQRTPAARAPRRRRSTRPFFANGLTRTACPFVNRGRTHQQIGGILSRQLTRRLHYLRPTSPHIRAARRSPRARSAPRRRRGAPQIAPRAGSAPRRHFLAIRRRSAPRRRLGPWRRKPWRSVCRARVVEWSTSRRRHHKNAPQNPGSRRASGPRGRTRRTPARRRASPAASCGFPRLRHFFGPLRCYRFRHLLLLLAPPAAPGIWRRRGQAWHQEQPLHLAVCCLRGAAISFAREISHGVWC